MGGEGRWKKDKPFGRLRNYLKLVKVRDQPTKKKKKKKKKQNTKKKPPKQKLDGWAALQGLCRLKGCNVRENGKSFDGGPRD